MKLDLLGQTGRRSGARKTNDRKMAREYTDDKKMKFKIHFFPIFLSIQEKRRTFHAAWCAHFCLGWGRWRCWICATRFACRVAEPNCQRSNNRIKLVLSGYI